MKVLIDNGSGYVDYTSYVEDGSLQITDEINVPTLTSFVLVNKDNVFVPPSRSAYCRIVSDRYVGSNWLLWSEDFTQSIYSAANVTVVQDGTLAPDGLSKAWKITATANVATMAKVGTAVATPSGVTYTIYAKKGNSPTAARSFLLRNATTFADILAVSINYDTGAITYNVGSSGAKIQRMRNGWWRIVLTATSGMSAGNNIACYGGFIGNGAATVGDYCYLFGMQLEKALYPGSYTKTTSATVATPTPKVLATGFVTNDPAREFLGLAPAAGKLVGFHMQRYNVTISSDDWLLNVNTVPFIPAFVNQGQGDILKAIANAVAPGFFDTTGLNSGDLVPYYQYDPTKNWSDLAKEFGDSARYRYKAIDKKLYYVPFGDDSLGMLYDETQPGALFDPYALQTGVLTVPPVNDCIVLGDTEPQNKREDVFVGDGFTSDFGLQHSAFEAALDMLLQEDWTGSSFTKGTWNAQDPGGNFFLTGALNIVGGPGSLGSSYIQGINGVELGGGLNLQHGEFLFNAASAGVVGGVYSSSDFKSYTNLLLWSEDITQWSKNALGTGVVPTVTNLPSTLMPDGTIGTVSRVQLNKGAGTTAGDYSNVTAGMSGSLTAATTYTNSVWIKSNDGVSHQVLIRLGYNTAVVTVTTSWQRFSIVRVGGVNDADLTGPSVWLRGTFATDNTADILVTFGEVEQSSTAGVYVKTTGAPVTSVPSLVAGFDISTPGTATPSASGASGIAIQPRYNGLLVGSSVITRQNHHYFLQTVFNGQLYDRSDSIYRSLAGPSYGGSTLSSGAYVTFMISDIDMANPNATPVVTKFTVSASSIAPFGLYLPVNNSNLNLTMLYTMIAYPPQGTLLVKSLYGPTGVYLPIKPAQLDAEQHHLLGFGFMNQVATIAKNGDVDQLRFYDDTIPRSGARIRLQTWDAGVAIGRVQDAAAIATEAKVSGDTGVRMAIMPDLKPVPRTSEECELAAAAAIKDRVSTQYQGSYSFLDDFWFSGADYPRPGRYLYVNAPQRLSASGNFFVTGVKSTVLTLDTEKIGYQLSFGPDMYLEKLLQKFMQRSNSILTPKDAADSPSPVAIASVGTSFAGDLHAANVIAYDSTTVTIDVGAAPATGVEVRRSDAGWGTSTQNLIGIFSTQQFTLQRGQYNQIWYMRMKNGSKYSRFSYIVRVQAPLIPAAPTATLDLTSLQKPVINVDASTQDIRNICGIEVRAADNSTVLFQRAYLSPTDLSFVYDNTVTKTRSFVFYIYFFNLFWGYSQPYVLNVTQPAPVLSAVVDEVGQQIVASITVGQCIQVEYQVWKDAGLTVLAASGIQGANLLAGSGSGTNAYPLSIEDVVQERWIRVRGYDYVGAGSFTSTLDHVYTTTGVGHFDNVDNVDSVKVPPTPQTDPTYGASFTDYELKLKSLSWQTYQKISRLMDL